MRPYRPTTLTLERQHCAAAISHYEHGTPELRLYTPHVGIAAHACLERIGQYAREIGENPSERAAYKLTATVYANLATTGRKFDGVQSPPLPIDACIEGAELANIWHAMHGLSPSALYEVGIGFSKTPPEGHWPVVPYDPDSNRWRLIADVIDIDEEEGLAVVLDYKSSWAAGPHFLRHLQQKAQALAVIDYAHHHRIALWGVEVGIANLRTRKVFSRVLDIQQDKEELAQWRQQLSIALDVLDKQAKPNEWRPARPGLGCLDCPYRPRCAPGMALMGNASQEDIARQAIMATNWAGSLRALAKRADDGRPVHVDGKAIGWVPKRTVKVNPSASRAIAEQWCPEAADSVTGLLSTIGLTASQLEALAPMVAGADADDFVKQHTTVEVGAHFGIGNINDPDQPHVNESRKKPPKETPEQKLARQWGHGE